MFISRVAAESLLITGGGSVILLITFLEIFSGATNKNIKKNNCTNCIKNTHVTKPTVH